MERTEIGVLVGSYACNLTNEHNLDGIAKFILF